MKGITRLRNRLRGPGGVIELLGVAVPLFVSNACETVMLFTDRLFLARVGPAQVSASMGGGLTAFMFMTFFLGLTGYANALVAQYYGAGRRERVARVVAQALWISLAAYPIILCCIPLGRRLFDVMGVASAQQIYQRPYFTILMCGSLLGLLRHSVSAHFSGIGRTRTIMAAAAVMMAVNIGANYVLIFGKLGLPALGIRGAAFGTLLGSFGLFFMLFLLFVRYIPMVAMAEVKTVMPQADPHQGRAHGPAAGPVPDAAGEEEGR